MDRKCPECGRTVNTRTNRLHIETWPPHNVARIGNASGAEAQRISNENRQRDPGQRDWEIQCPMSGQPV